MTTKRELLEMLEQFDDNDIIVCMDEEGGWDNIIEVKKEKSLVAIIFGGGSPFSDEQ